jgi:solute carrier family 25 S-adenosylmethionine transporter 26
MISGALAGISVDMSLYPIDTIKTRLQSPHGFMKAGGFKGIYNGIGAVTVGGGPGASLFFTTYETSKPHLEGFFGKDKAHYAHMTAACAGETMACLVRVPTDVIKTSMQTNAEGCTTVVETMKTLMKNPASPGVANLYRGFGVTIMREIPFALIQFPLYERFKLEVGKYQNAPATPIQSAVCGSIGGGIAAALTTPLDVVKTRLMIGVDKHNVPYKGAVETATRIVSTEGAITLFNGVQPRVMWISIGGFVFFGAYETAKNLTGAFV